MGNRMIQEMGIPVKRWNVFEVTTEERCRRYIGGILKTMTYIDYG
jgi:hypothetical protein